MDNKRITEALLLLAAGDEHRTQIARLRDIFDAVETVLAAGVSRTAILDALHRQGFSMTLRTFDNAVYRIRKRNKKIPTMRAAPTAKMQIQNEEAPLPVSYDPADLTRIMSAPVDLDALSKHSRRKKVP